jgi:hypothetical protein
MREAAALTNGQRFPDVPAGAARRSDRRHGRLLALARCSPYAAAFLATWIAVASLSSASGLLVAKRPQGAWAAPGEVCIVAVPMPADSGRRLRARGIRRVRRRDLRGLFASPQAGFSHDPDAIHEAGPVGTPGRAVLPWHAGLSRRCRLRGHIPRQARGGRHPAVRPPVPRQRR